MGDTNHRLSESRSCGSRVSLRTAFVSRRFRHAVAPPPRSTPGMARGGPRRADPAGRTSDGPAREVPVRAAARVNVIHLAASGAPGPVVHGLRGKVPLMNCRRLLLFAVLIASAFMPGSGVGPGGHDGVHHRCRPRRVGRRAARGHGGGREPGADREGPYATTDGTRPLPDHQPAAGHLHGDLHAGGLQHGQARRAAALGFGGRHRGHRTAARVRSKRRSRSAARARSWTCRR